VGQKRRVRFGIVSNLDRADEELDELGGGKLWAKKGVSGSVLSVTETSITILPEADDDDDGDDADDPNDIIIDDDDDDGDDGTDPEDVIVDEDAMTFDFAEDVFLFMKGNIVGEGGSEVAASSWTRTL